MGMGWHDRLDIKEWICWLVRQYPDSEIVLYGVSMGAAAVMMLPERSCLPTGNLPYYIRSIRTQRRGSIRRWRQRDTVTRSGTWNIHYGGRTDAGRITKGNGRSTVEGFLKEMKDLGFGREEIISRIEHFDEEEEV